VGLNAFESTGSHTALHATPIALAQGQREHQKLVRTSPKFIAYQIILTQYCFQQILFSAHRVSRKIEFEGGGTKYGFHH